MKRKSSESLRVRHVTVQIKCWFGGITSGKMHVCSSSFVKMWTKCLKWLSSNSLICASRTQNISNNFGAKYFLNVSSVKKLLVPSSPPTTKSRNVQLAKPSVLPSLGHKRNGNNSSWAVLFNSTSLDSSKLPNWLATVTSGKAFKRSTKLWKNWVFSSSDFKGNSTKNECMMMNSWLKNSCCKSELNLGLAATSILCNSFLHKSRKLVRLETSSRN